MSRNDALQNPAPAPIHLRLQGGVRLGANFHPVGDL